MTASSPVLVKKGAAQATQQAKPLPYARAVTVWREPGSGKFAKDPAAQPQAGSVTLDHRPPAADVLVFSHLLDWGDGSAPEVVRVSIECQSARAALLLGEASKQALSNFEADIALSTLQEVNPVRAREFELEEMHKAHRIAKGQRSAVSRQRNEKARAEDQAKGYKPRKTKR